MFNRGPSTAAASDPEADQSKNAPALKTKQPAKSRAAAPHPDTSQGKAKKSKRKKEIDPANLDANGNHIVGKNRTPVHTRWKPGQSGNPGGKKPRTLNTDTEVLDFLEGDITIQTSKGPETMSKAKSLLLKLYEKAIKGDRNAIVALLNMHRAASDRRAGIAEDDPEELTPEELALLEALLADPTPETLNEERIDDD
jgi:hypothetical protein